MIVGAGVSWLVPPALRVTMLSNRVGASAMSSESLANDGGSHMSSEYHLNRTLLVSF